MVGSVECVGGVASNRFFVMSSQVWKCLRLRFQVGWGGSLLLLLSPSCHHGRELGHLLWQEGGEGDGDGLGGLGPGYETGGLLLE